MKIFAPGRPRADPAVCEQVETIGDAYMVVSGAPEQEHNHAEKVCNMALDMIDAITDLKDPSTGQCEPEDSFVRILIRILKILNPEKYVKIWCSNIGLTSMKLDLKGLEDKAHKCIL